MMRASQALSWTVVVALILAGASCATDSAKQGFATFLKQIAQDCKPLVIGTEDFSQAIVFNGLGVDQEDYTNFLGKTEALYYGAIPAQVYRDSLTAFIGTGTYNDRSFACIIAHVPKL